MLPAKRVRLVGVPVALFLAAEQHTNDLLREIALMAAARPGTGHLFSDTLSTAETYAHRPASVRDRIVESIGIAQRAGWDTVTVDVEADESAADGALAWEELLRRFDAMSRDERLLTLPADGELVAYRSWYVRELVEQVRTGRDPVPWARAGVLAGAH
ncbi:MAG TPA: hypothetical protein VFQ85_08660 [Mycobacteriales bacterium]|nr:hypothetical protein [Mycobacteriales bacterium]